MKDQFDVREIIQNFDHRFLARGIHEYDFQAHQGVLQDGNYGWIYTHKETWVYGYPVTFDYPRIGRMAFIIEGYSHSTGGIVHPQFQHLQVKPESICRFTGSVDVNKRPIFEHDIIKIIGLEDELCVLYDEGSWGFAEIGNDVWSYPLQNFSSDELEVVDSLCKPISQ